MISDHIGKLLLATFDTPNLMSEKWETMLTDDLTEVRARYGVTASPAPVPAVLPVAL